MVRCLAGFSTIWFVVGCQAPEGPDLIAGGPEGAIQSRDGGAASDAGGDQTSWRERGAGGAIGGAGAPPPSWQETWFGHDQLVKKVAEADDYAIYFDAGVGLSSVDWIQPFIASIWTYAKKTYGVPGDPHLYAIFHAGRYPGWNASSMFEPTVDYRNVIDVGGSMTEWDMPDAVPPIAYSIGHILEASPFGYDGLPSLTLTRSQWQYFFPYDAFKAVGMNSIADEWLTSLMKYSVDQPRTGTYWARDWYYPLWRDYGGSGVFVRFMRLVIDHYPKVPRADGRGMTFVPAMTWGEYIHFMSGAAGADLKNVATKAFGWPDGRDAEYEQAKRDFPSIKY